MLTLGHLAKESEWVGTVFTPLGNIVVKKDVSFAGAFYSGNQVDLDKGISGVFTSADRFLAPRITVELLNDTGESATDGLTFDPTITGTVTDENVIASVQAGFDGTATEDFFDVPFDTEGRVTIDADLLADLGIVLADGPHILRLRATDEYDNMSRKQRRAASKRDRGSRGRRKKRRRG